MIDYFSMNPASEQLNIIADKSRSFGSLSIFGAKYIKQDEAISVLVKQKEKPSWIMLIRVEASEYNLYRVFDINDR